MRKELELNQKLYNMIKTIERSNNHSELYCLFFMLYKFGMRVRELKDIQKWRDNGEFYIVSTSKFGAKRGLSKADIESKVIDEIEKCIKGESSLWKGRSYKQIHRVGMMYMRRLNITINGKHKPTHVFRHNNIKMLKLSGFPDRAIKNHIGLKNERNVRVYSNSIL